MAAAVLFLAGICSLQAGTKTWNTTSGDWFADGNWAGGGRPVAGDDVVITNAGASVLLTNSTEYLSSLVISNTATLVFSNWNTALSATNVYIRTNATVTLPAAFTTNQMSNNVYFVCSNLTLDVGGKIDVDAKGWAGGTNATGGNGPGRGKGTGIAAGYGGWGGGSDCTTYGLTYGSATNPLAPGSGGDNSTTYPTQVGKAGGGAIRIEATGLVTVNGTITANGGNSGGFYTGAGSGGGIYITCSTMQGAGVVRADGGTGWAANNGGWVGGGGRIAVIYNTTLQTSVTPVPTIQFSTAPGVNSTGSKGGGIADLGTLYFSDTQLIGLSIPHNGKLIAGNWTNWLPATLMITNGWVRLPNEGFQLTVSNNLTLTGSGAKLELGGNQVRQVGAIVTIYTETNGPTLTCGGNLLLTNSSSLWIYSGMAARSNYGARVTVAGDVVLATNCWIYPVSHPTNGASVLFQMRNLTILTPNAGFNANDYGYTCGYFTSTDNGVGYGPGGSSAAGGSYGGRGGGSSAYGAATYGSSNAPVEPGSGGKNGSTYKHYYGSGGGLIRLDVTGVLTLNGSLTVNGQNAPGNYEAGGAGGGIYVTCRRFAGAGGILSAMGGSGSATAGGCGGGGGGRIAVWRISDQSSGWTATVAGGIASGANYNGEVGTIVWGWLPPPGTVFVLR